jgi:hypothetical protein
MDTTERERLIQQYADGYATIAAALDGIGELEWEAREAPGEWSPREVVHHLADSEMTSAIRLRRLLAEDVPEIPNYDEAEWARRLHYDRPVEGSLAAFRAARESTVPLLRALDEDEWAREGTHSASGRYRVEDWLRIYAEHAPDHADQIRRARAAR